MGSWGLLGSPENWWDAISRRWELCCRELLWLAVREKLGVISKRNMTQLSTLEDEPLRCSPGTVDGFFDSSGWLRFERNGLLDWNFKKTEMAASRCLSNDFNTPIKISSVIHQRALKKVMIQTLHEPHETFSALGITGKTPCLKT